MRWSIFLYMPWIYPCISSVNCLLIAFIHLLLVYMSHWFVSSIFSGSSSIVLYICYKYFSNLLQYFNLLKILLAITSFNYYFCSLKYLENVLSCAFLMLLLLYCFFDNLEFISGYNRNLEKEIATHSSILGWKTPWTEVFGGLQSMGLQRVRHNLATKQQ